MRLFFIRAALRSGENRQNVSMRRCFHCVNKGPSSVHQPIASPRGKPVLRFGYSTPDSRGFLAAVGPQFSMIATWRRGLSSVDFAGDDSSEEDPQTKAEIEFRKTITEILLDDDRVYPIGSISQELILDAESALLSWANERSAAGFDFSLKLLKRLVEEQEAQQQGDDSGKISISDSQRRQPYFIRRFLVSRVVDSWRICWCARIVDMEPSSMLTLLEELQVRGVAIDNRALTMVVDGMLKRGDAFEAPLLAQWVLDQRMEEAEDNPSLRPDSFLLTSVIRAWAKSGRMEAPEMAEGILDLMHDLFHNGWEDSGPNLVSYSATMDAWSRSRRPEAPKAMDRLLAQMKDSTIPGLEPDTFIYTHVINTWARSRSPIGVQKAGDYLAEMIELYESGNDIVVPQASVFARVIYAMAKTGDAQRAEAEYKELKRLYNRTRDPRLKPNEECKKAMLTALSRKGTSKRAQQVLNEMVDAAVAGDDRMPRRSYFIDLLVAWTKEQNPIVAAKESEKTLRQMVDLARMGFPELMPDSLSFFKVAKAWSRVRDAKAEERVESLLRLMERLYQDTGSSALKPSGKFMEVLVLSLCRSSHPDSSNRAESLISDMENAYSAGDSGMKPSRGIYTNLMQALIRNKKTNHNAVQEIFDKLNILYSQGHTGYRPDLMVYSALMDSWAQRGDPIKVQSIFEGMIEDFNRGNDAAKPDMQAFNTILKAWSCSENPNRGQKAELVLRKLPEFGDAAGLGFKPDAFTYVQMIWIWCGSDAEDASEKARFHLRSMIEMGFEPSFSLYCAVLRSLLKKGDKDSTQHAAGLVEDMLVGVQSKKVGAPLPKIYRQFLECVANSSIPGRNQQARNLLSTVPERKVPRVLMPSLRC
jgi:hypothetical protein